jgi:cytochrome P450
MWIELGRPPCFWFDMTPVGLAILVNADPGIAEAITEPRPGLKYSTPKSDTTHSLHRLIGWESMVLVHGEEWRSLRRRFNKGFAPQHLHSLAPLILDRTQIFISRLKSLAKTGETFRMQDLAQDLTTDIITVVALERDFGAQTTPDGQGEKSRFGIFTTSRMLSEQAFKVGQGFNLLYAIDPVRPFLSWLNEAVLNWRLYNIVSKQISSPSNPSSTKDSSTAGSRSIISLATSSLPPSRALIKNTVSQIKTFLFAGQDTTATLIQWLCFELSKCATIPPSDPHYAHYQNLYAAILAEHDVVFAHPDDPFSAIHLLSDPKSSEATINTRLPVTNAWVKEALRLHPPAGTARFVPFESAEQPGFEIPLERSAPNTTDPDAHHANGNTAPRPSAATTTTTTTKTAKINGLRVYNAQHLLHRDPRTWGPQANLFDPHRWLSSSSPSYSSSNTTTPSHTTFSPNQTYTQSLPPGAFRPFERGPRNCIGQTLAVVEAVVVLCCVARGLVFEKRDGGSGVGGEAEVHSVFRVTSVVGDGMRMGVRMSGEKEL